MTGWKIRLGSVLPDEMLEEPVVRKLETPMIISLCHLFLIVNTVDLSTGTSILHMQNQSRQI